VRKNTWKERKNRESTTGKISEEKEKIKENRTKQECQSAMLHHGFVLRPQEMI
jgi:hypothetical protein